MDQRMVVEFVRQVIVLGYVDSLPGFQLAHNGFFIKILKRRIKLGGASPEEVPELVNLLNAVKSGNMSRKAALRRVNELATAGAGKALETSV